MLRLIGLILFFWTNLVMAKELVIDLRDFDFENEVYEFDKPLEFYWGKLLKPEEIARENKYELAHQPSSSWQKGVSLSDHGQASYRVKILTPNDQKLLLGSYWSLGAKEIYVNSKPVYKSGSFEPYLADENGFSLVVQPTDGILELVILIKSHEFYLTGPGPLRLGLEAVFFKKLFHDLIPALILCSFALCFFMFHFLLFILRRKDKANLYFSLLSLGVSSYVFAADIVGILEFYNYQTNMILFNSWIPAGGFFFLYISDFFNKEFKSKYLKNSGTFLVFWFIFSLSFKLHWIAYSAFIPQLLVLASSVYIVIRLSFFADRTKENIIFLLGFFVFLVCSINDMLSAYAWIDTLTLGAAGFLVLLTSQSFLLARRFVRALDVSENYASLLEKQEQMRTAFFHNTSHELRTPLNGVIGFSEVLLSGSLGKLNSAQSSRLQKIKSLSESLKYKVNTILDLAKGDKGELSLRNQLLSIDELKQSCELLLEGLVIDQTNLSYEIQASDSERFVGDKDKILSIAQNLISNACKFSASDRANHVEISLIKNQDILEISVKDSGIGIASEDHTRIFEAFNQVDHQSSRNYEGTGLGLNLVKKLCELMNASITVDSALGRGSHFKVSIPESESVDVAQEVDQSSKLEVELPTSHDETTELIAARGHWNIWVIDDHQINCDLICDLLSHNNYKLTSFQRAKEALEQMRKSPPDLLILDLMMPEMSGEELLQLIRADRSLALIPVIVLTARASEADRIFVFSLGADEYLAKPIIPKELFFRVYHILERKALEQGLHEEKEQKLQSQSFLRTAIANLAHKTNNPLNYIQTNIHFLEGSIDTHMQTVLALMDEDDSEPAKALKEEFSDTQAEFQKSLQAMHLGMKRSLTAINEIRSLSGLDGLEVKKIQLVSFIDELESRLNESCQTNFERIDLIDMPFYANEACLFLAMEKLLDLRFKGYPIQVKTYRDEKRLTLEFSSNASPREDKLFQEKLAEYRYILSAVSIELESDLKLIRLSLETDYTQIELAS